MLWGFPGDQMVKNLPATQETRVQSLGQEDPLEEEIATHSSILTLEIPWTEAIVHGVKKSQRQLSYYTFARKSRGVEAERDPCKE